MNKRLLEKPTAWEGHMEFATKLVETLKPKVIVELGTHWGHSFFAMVEGATKGCKCIAVDNWMGDPHAGYYGDEVYRLVQEVKKDYPKKDVDLWRMEFNEAARQYREDDIDILHIDGLHTYDAVRHDYDTWKKKVKGNGVIMFHDIHVRQSGFGVFMLWETLKRFHPDWYFIDKHGSNGLGIMTKSKKVYNQIINMGKEE